MSNAISVISFSLLLKSIHILTSFCISTGLDDESRGHSRVTVTKNYHSWKGFLYICHGCKTPSRDGVLVEVFTAARGIDSFNIENERLAYAFPNHGHSDSSGSDYFNEEIIPDAILIMDAGGGVSIIEKARQAQRQKASGVIIIDSETDKVEEEIRILSNHLFDTTDHWAFWDTIKIPCILIRENMSAKFLSHAMNLEETKIEGLNRIHHVSF
jgi:hypothetical protein